MSQQSTVSIARTGTKSLRATIPEDVVTFLDLREGDKIEWIMEGSTERIVIVRKVKPPVLSDDITDIAAKYTKRIKGSKA